MEKQSRKYVACFAAYSLLQLSVNSPFCLPSSCILQFKKSASPLQLPSGNQRSPPLMGQHTTACYWPPRAGQLRKRLQLVAANQRQTPLISRRKPQFQKCSPLERQKSFRSCSPIHFILQSAGAENTPRLFREIALLRYFLPLNTLSLYSSTCSFVHVHIC